MKLIFELILSLTILVVVCECSPRKPCNKAVDCALVLCSMPPKKCEPGYSIQPAGYCLCCEACIRIVYEGHDCSLPDPIIVKDQVVCADGLECKDNICRKKNASLT